MTATHFSDAKVLGRRKEPHTVIIARGDRIRHFTVRPWLAALAGCAALSLTVGYFGATAYLVLRDDLMNAAVSSQARMQQAYEDRISALRSQVDRITSRQMLDQQLVETKVSELLSRQAALSGLDARLTPLLPEKAGAPSPVTPLPLSTDTAPIRGGAGLFELQPETERKPAGDSLSQADQADRAFVAMNRSLQSVEADQMRQLTQLTNSAYQTTDGIESALASAGLEWDRKPDEAMGGPYLPASNASAFDARVEELDEALGRLRSMRARAARLPLANPAAGSPVTSTFGVRSDPLLGTPALHAGIDFRASIGTPVVATGTGRVVTAGWNGSYGKMVEIDHGGYTTRFAHMSEVAVKNGDMVKAGQLIGRTGNTGRSTGPHLHYEVRKSGDAVDPLRFLKAGRKLRDFL
ncbi:MAG: M23 family metallopeptidase [Methylobacterium mesophilicum]|nr:M23 family metallopeptidase [Methylobacterium mesophilicum]